LSPILLDEECSTGGGILLVCIAFQNSLLAWNYNARALKECLDSRMQLVLVFGKANGQGERGDIFDKEAIIKTSFITTNNKLDDIVALDNNKGPQSATCGALVMVLEYIASLLTGCTHQDHSASMLQWKLKTPRHILYAMLPPSSAISLTNTTT
jgi:hypothetical protein